MVPHSSRCDQGVAGGELPIAEVWSVSLGRIFPLVERDMRQVFLERWRGFVWGATRHLPGRTRPNVEPVQVRLVDVP
eukprot:1547573-Rhodomonas_salina.1